MTSFDDVRELLHVGIVGALNDPPPRIQVERTFVDMIVHRRREFEGDPAVNVLVCEFKRTENIASNDRHKRDCLGSWSLRDSQRVCQMTRDAPLVPGEPYGYAVGAVVTLNKAQTEAMVRRTLHPALELNALPEVWGQSHAFGSPIGVPNKNIDVVFT
jgi:hypothetical protein